MTALGQNKQMAQALRHVELLTGHPNTKVCLRFIHDSDKALPAACRDGAISELWPDIEARQAEGFGIFVVVNGGGQNDDAIDDIRALHIDGDDIPLPDRWHVEPDFIVRRGDTHWHAYWRVLDMPVEEFKAAQKRLIAFYGSDKKVFNPSRVMRLAGTMHLKDPQNPQLMTLNEREGIELAWFGRPAAELVADLPEIQISAVEKRDAPEGFTPDQPWNVARARRYVQGLVKHGDVAILGPGADMQVAGPPVGGPI